MTTQITTHKNIPIFVDVYGRFTTEDTDERGALSADTLEGLKGQIDKQAVRKKERFPGYVVDSHGTGNITAVTVTSIWDARHWQGGTRKECWISIPDKSGKGASRSKHNGADIYKSTPANDDLVSKLRGLARDIQGLQRQYTALREQLESFDPAADERERRERAKDRKAVAHD